MATKRSSKKSAAKRPARKRPLNNKGTKRHPSGRHSFANTELAKELKAHGKYMPHGYEIELRVIDSKTGKPVRKKS